MEDVIIVVSLLAIVIGIVWYIWREKKRGTKCIGCSYAKQCGGKCSGGCGHTESDNQYKHQ